MAERARHAPAPVLLAVMTAMLAACGQAEAPVGLAASGATGIEDHEGAVCGMLVRNQPAPRAQVVRRDGERFFLCSIGDLLVHLEAPSPHGDAREVFVEVLPPDADPLVPRTGEHPWVPADRATYVVGVQRRGIMGEPVLAFESAEVATRVARTQPGATSVDFDALLRWWRARQARG